MSATLPMFPLGTVLFPGVVVPLRVFEDRYRALVHHLIREPDPAHRLFGSVGIREGYEVGDHGAQSLFRVGCRMQLTDVESHDDGTFDIIAVGRDRIRLDRHPEPLRSDPVVLEGELADRHHATHPDVLDDPMHHGHRCLDVELRAR